MSVIEEGQIQIHTENIFPIIKKAVYSDHEIFLRELISNAIDAINKRRMASMAGDCEGIDEGCVEITIDTDKKTIKVSDNGIGMSEEEVKKYINQVAFSSAEEFLERYKTNQEGIIGHFGLGFYSSFMVAKNVEIITKSANDSSEPVKWSCDGSPKFTLEKVEKADIGTDIILYIMQEELEYIEPVRIRNLITKYCDYMPFKVKLDNEVINKMDPPWRSSPRELKDQDYIDLYKYLYPFQGDPLFWIHLNTDYPYNLQGILYFPKSFGRADWEKGEIKLYSNQVFVSDSIKEVVPRYLLPLRGVIDSTDIPLNVSRSALQTDRKVRSIGGFIAKKIADKLKSIKKDDEEFFSKIWDSISPYIKIGVMEDEKFAEQITDSIIFTTRTNNIKEDLPVEKNYIINGDLIYTTIENYINRLEVTDNKRILYCTDEVSQSTALSLWIDQGFEVLITDTVIDSQFIPWLESKNTELKFQRVDSELDESIKDDTPEITDKDGQSASEKIINLVKEAIKNDKVTIQVQALKGESSLPSMILLPEQMRRINDIGALMEQRLPGIPDNHVLLINKNHALVKGLLKLKSSTIVTSSGSQSENEDLSNDIAIHLYDMAKMSVGGLDPKSISDFQSRNAFLIGKLLEKAF